MEQHVDELLDHLDPMGELDRLRAPPATRQVTAELAARYVGRYPERATAVLDERDRAAR